MISSFDSGPFPREPLLKEAIRSVTHLVLALAARESNSSTIEPKGTGGTRPLPVPPGPLFCSTVRIPVAPGLVKSAPPAFVSFTPVHDWVSPAATSSQLWATNPARPTRFGESRKRSVPVRVHSVSKSFGFVGSRHQAPGGQPVFDSRHGRIACKVFPRSVSLHYKVVECGRLQSVPRAQSQPVQLADGRAPKFKFSFRF